MVEGVFFYWNHLLGDFEVCQVEARSGRFMAFFPKGRSQDWCRTGDFFLGPIETPPRPKPRLIDNPLTESRAKAEFAEYYSGHRRNLRLMGLPAEDRRLMWRNFIKTEIALGHAPPEAIAWDYPRSRDDDFFD